MNNYLKCLGLTGLLALAGCSNYFKNDYTDNSPTSGKLKVYYDAGLQPQISNQAYTFEALYEHAHVELFPSSEDDAVQALYKDSCELIIISRPLSQKEKSAFASKNYFPKYSAVAMSGVALITNSSTPLTRLSYLQVVHLLSENGNVSDSLNKPLMLKVLFDKNNSSVVHYLRDSVLKGRAFSANCNILGSTLQSINYVAENKNVVAFVDFSWLSDMDDSLYKANKDRLRFLCISRNNDSLYEYPNPSSFKLGTYAFARKVYVYRKTGDFTLAKGFESFIAGPKGQLTFLKQGLLPTRQGERNIQINTKPLNEK